MSGIVTKSFGMEPSASEYGAAMNLAHKNLNRWPDWRVGFGAGRPYYNSPGYNIKAPTGENIDVYKSAGFGEKYYTISGTSKLNNKSLDSSTHYPDIEEVMEYLLALFNPAPTKSTSANSVSNRDVAYDSAENMKRDIVLAFIHDCNGKRIGMSVFERATYKVVAAEVPDTDYRSWNLNITNGQLSPKCCDLGAFPIVVKSSLNGTATVEKPKASAWVIGAYPDGRLRLVSVWGQIKTVTMQTALDFHRKYTIANVTDDGTKLVPTKVSKFPTIVAD